MTVAIIPSADAREGSMMPEWRGGKIQRLIWILMQYLSSHAIQWVGNAGQLTKAIVAIGPDSSALETPAHRYFSTKRTAT